jgi:hypothetical protein
MKLHKLYEVFDEDTGKRIGFACDMTSSGVELEDLEARWIAQYSWKQSIVLREPVSPIHIDEIMHSGRTMIAEEVTVP